MHTSDDPSISYVAVDDNNEFYIKTELIENISSCKVIKNSLFYVCNTYGLPQSYDFTNANIHFWVDCQESWDNLGMFVGSVSKNATIDMTNTEAIG